jgi:hypothetical protein
MAAKILRTLGIVGLVVGMGSLSACFDAYYRAHPAYSYGGPPPYWYGSPAGAFSRSYPVYTPAPRYYAYNPGPNWRYRREHEEHEEWRHEELRHESQEHHRDRDHHRADRGGWRAGAGG